MEFGEDWPMKYIVSRDVLAERLTISPFTAQYMLDVMLPVMEEFEYDGIELEVGYVTLEDARRICEKIAKARLN